MTFLPIVERELRVRARLRGTYRFRLGAAAVSIAIVAFLLILDEGFGGVGNFGGGTFNTMAVLCHFYCLLEGLRNTSDCLSEEKRAGTLGLLFLTDLRGYDVVLGKLMATSLNSFYALLAVFPPLGITLIQGGVTGGEFWRLILALVNTLFFSLTAGLCVSAASRDERRAWGGTLAVIAFFSIVPASLESVKGLPGWLQLPISPTSAFWALDAARYDVNPGRFWTALWSVHGLSWFLLVMACWVLPRSWQDAPRTEGESWIRRWLGRRTGASPDRLDAARRELLEVNPVIWLVSRGEREAMSLWTVVLSASALVAGVWVFAMGSSAVALALGAAVVLLHLGLAMWVASEACHVFAGARDSGALELLLSTPLSIREVIQGSLQGLKRLFFRPVVLLLLVEGLLVAGQIVVMESSGGSTTREIIFTLLAVGLFVAMAIMDLVAVGYYGLWMGLSTKNTGKAVTKTILHVLLLPLLGVACVALWPVLGVVKDAIFIGRAREMLRRYFRAVVTEQYGLGKEVPYVGDLTTRRKHGQLPRVWP